MRQVVGTDRAVRIEAKVANTGTVPVDGAGGGTAGGRPGILQAGAAPIPPNGSENVQFEHRFDRGGYHVLTARLVQSKFTACPRRRWRTTWPSTIRPSTCCT